MTGVLRRRPVSAETQREPPVWSQTQWTGCTASPGAGPGKGGSSLEPGRSMALWNPQLLTSGSWYCDRHTSAVCGTQFVALGTAALGNEHKRMTMLSIPFLSFLWLLAFCIRVECRPLLTLLLSLSSHLAICNKSVRSTQRKIALRHLLK